MAALPLDRKAEPAMGTALTAFDLERILEVRPAEVDAALQQVSPAGSRIGLVEIAALFGVTAEQDPAAFTVRTLAYLQTFNLIDEFTHVLLSEQEVPIPPEQLANMRIDPQAGERLFSRTVHARCAIFHDGAFQGSGCLVGPSLVLTCAHVIEPARRGDRFPGVEVRLSNHMRLGVEEKPVRISDTADADRTLPLARLDDVFGDRHDFALLRLRVPVSANVVIVPCPGEDWPPSSRAPLFVLHYPQGEERGVAVGQLESFNRPGVRWGYYSDEPKPGSSGGAVFNGRGELIGLHQGKLTNGSRLVPIKLFREHIAAEVANDLWPSHIWLPDGNIEGALVIGRGDLFRAFALMAPQGSSHRLLRIKRLDPTGGPGGLGFSVRLVRQLVDRLPKGHRELTLAWPQVLFHDFDIMDELAAIARSKGLLPPSADPGSSASNPAQASTARLLRYRVESVLGDLDARARAAGETVWIIVEHSAVQIGDQVVPLELLVATAAKLPALRVVLVGNETVSLPEPEFRLDDVAQNCLPGVTLVEYLGPVSRKDVQDFIAGLYESIYGTAPDSGPLSNWISAALADAKAELNQYPVSEIPKITARLREIFRPLMPGNPGGGP